VDDGTPRFRRLRFSDITARRVKYAAAYIMGLPEMHVEDVALENISFYLDPQNTQAGAADMAPGSAKLLRAGIVAHRVDKLTLRNIDISGQLGPAISVSDARDLLLSGCVFRTPSESENVKLENVERVPERKCQGVE
jgi:hypothetical protein